MYEYRSPHAPRELDPNALRQFHFKMPEGMHAELRSLDNKSEFCRQAIADALKRSKAST